MEKLESKQTFQEWFKELLEEGTKLEYPFVNENDPECWKDYYDSGYSPYDAILEDMSHLD